MADQPSAETVIHYTAEMGLTHADFFRLLPKAMGEHPFTVSGLQVQGHVYQGSLVIELGPQQVRRIALMAIPFAEVSFTFTGVSDEQHQQFKARFDLYYQRGGG